MGFILSTTTDRTVNDAKFLLFPVHYGTKIQQSPSSGRISYERRTVICLRLWFAISREEEKKLHTNGGGRDITVYIHKYIFVYIYPHINIYIHIHIYIQ